MPAAAAAAAALEEYTLLVFSLQTALAVEQLKVNANLCGPSSWLGPGNCNYLFLIACSNNKNNLKSTLSLSEAAT